MISVHDHLDRILASVHPLPPAPVPLAQAHQRVLAQDVEARFAVPPFDNSAMDGFAVRAADVAGASPKTPVQLTVRGEAAAGALELPQVEPGTAVRIMTGAPIPPGADAVVPVEATDQEAGPHAGKALASTVAVRESVATGRHIRRAGEDVVVGAHVLSAGTRLRARHLSAAASTGFGELLVRPRPRIGVLATGAELAAPGAELAPGHIPDSNSTLVAGLVSELGAEPVPLRTVSDDPSELSRLLTTALVDCDLLVTTGGVSAGAYDVVKEVLEGRVQFDRVAMQPGKPQGFGVLTASGGRAVPIITLPGNPVSVFVSFHVFVAPALARLAGAEATTSGLAAAVPALVGTGWRSSPGRVQFMPVTVHRDDDGAPCVAPVTGRGSGSHLVASLARADALAIVPAEVLEVSARDAVGVMMVP